MAAAACAHPHTATCETCGFACCRACAREEITFARIPRLAPCVACGKRQCDDCRGEWREELNAEGATCAGCKKSYCAACKGPHAYSQCAECLEWWCPSCSGENVRNSLCRQCSAKNKAGFAE